MANVKVWYPKQAKVYLKVATASPNFVPTLNLNTYFSSGSALTGIMKDISITEPIGDVDKIDLLGTDSQGFQNAEVEEKPASMGEISGTIVIPGTVASQRAMGVLYGAQTTGPSGYYTFRPGLATRTQNAILLDITDGTDEVAIGVAAGYTTAKDIKVTGADGHFEGTFTMKFLPKYYRIDLK